VHALAGERVQVDGRGGDQRLAFTGPHLGDAAVVQHHAADHLDVEMPLAQDALGGLAHDGEGLFENLVEGLAGGQAVLELLGLGAQLVVGERLHLRLESVDLGDPRVESLDLAVV